MVITAFVLYLCDERMAAPAPTAQWRHLGLGPRLVDHDEVIWINALLMLLPIHAAYILPLWVRACPTALLQAAQYSKSATLINSPFP